MPFSGNKIYGVLKATLTKDRGESSSQRSHLSHFNLTTSAAGEGYQVNIDIQSHPHEADVKYYIIENFGGGDGSKDAGTDASLKQQFADIQEGFTPLQPEPGGLALDLVKNPLFCVDDLKDATPQTPDEISQMLNGYLENPDTVASLIVFGTKYDDSNNDYHEQYNHYHYHDHNDWHRDRHMYGVRRYREDPQSQLPPRGVDDVHLNQGSGPQHSKDNGPYQDGALFIEHQDGSYTGIFFAFASQCFDTDANGNCVNSDSNQ